MPDETTKIADALVPAIWLPYMVKRSIELSALVQAGIMEADPEFQALIDDEKGEIMNMPHWNKLAGEDEVLSDDASLTTGKITAGQDAACVHHRGKAWSVNDLVKFMAGSDPADAIATLVAKYWIERDQIRLLALLEGIFNAASLANNKLDIAHTTGGAGSAGSAHTFNGETFIDAKQKLGDHKETLTAIAMHSLVEASLEKQGLIDSIRDDVNGGFIKVYQGLRVIVDDNMPQEERDGDVVFTTYLFGRGAIGYAVSRNNHVPQGASPGSTWQLAWARNELAGVSHMVNRRRFIMHPRGIKWTNANKAKKTGPTNTEMKDGANWTLVYEPKDIRIVQFKHNISA